MTHSSCDSKSVRLGAASLMLAVVTCHAQTAGLPVVMVQAQKVLQDEQEVALSMEVQRARDLERAGLRDLFDLSALSASVTGGGLARVGAARLGIRGINDFARNQGFDGSVAVYVDGVYAGRQPALSQSLAGIEQVEVLRGPQGTLLGRNTVAGAVMLTTRKPADRFEFSAAMEGGEFGRRRAWAWLGGPLESGAPGASGVSGADAPAVRSGGQGLSAALMVSDSQDGGYVRNLFRDGNRPTQQRTQAARGQLQWKGPHGLRVEWSVESYGHVGQRYNGEALEVGTRPFNLAPGPWSTAVDTRSTERITRNGAALTVQAPLRSAWMLTSITAVQRHRSRYDDAEGDWTPLELIETDYAVSDLWQFTQEARVTKSWGAGRQMVVGAHLMDQRNAERFSSVTGADYPAPGSPAQARLANRRTLGDGTLRLRSSAAFGHAEWALNPVWGVLAGVRLTEERKSVAFRHEADPVLSALGLFPLAPFTAELRERDVSPRVGLTARIGPQTMAYATRSTAFKSGGYNLDGITAVLTDPARQLRFDSEQVTAHEVGVKSRWWDGALRVNAAVYDADGRNYQVQQFVALPTGATSIAITNAGRVSLRGLEMDARAQLGGVFTLVAGLHRGRARFDEFLNGGGLGVNYNGNHLPYAPDQKVSAALEARSDWAGLPLQASVIHSRVSAQFSNADNRSRNAIAPYATTGARFSLGGAGRAAGWTVTLWGENLRNTAYLVSQDRSFTGVVKGLYGPPRTLGLTVSVDQ